MGAPLSDILVIVNRLKRDIIFVTNLLLIERFLHILTRY